MLIIGQGHFLKAVLMVFAILWIREVVGRLGSDVVEFKTTTDRIGKLTIGFWWLLTVFVIWWLIATVVGIAAGILQWVQ